MTRFVFAALLSIFVGCKQPTNLQPLIAVAGTYSLMAMETPAPPAPPPAPAGCAKGCKCNGTGREPTGDGLSTVPCRCPDGCACKTKSIKSSGTICTTGTCAGWPPRNINR